MQKKKHILIIASNYYQKIYDNLLKESVDEISFQNFLYTTETVTGVFEIPSIITFAKNKFDGYITLGCVIRGETTHYDYVCGESARGLTDLINQYSLAVGYGILTTENREQAWERASRAAGNKGDAAANACLDMIELKKHFGLFPR